jgi:hypothetical protein
LRFILQLRQRRHVRSGEQLLRWVRELCSRWNLKARQGERRRGERRRGRKRR